jgi:predicted small metal-binding protein
MKQLRCSDVGFACDKIIQGEDEQDVMTQVAEHGREVHGLTEIDEETGQKIRAQIVDVA